MVNMKRRKAAPSKNEVCETVPADDQYPWGLRLTVGTEELDKLDLGRLPLPGAVVSLSGKARVVSVSEEVRGRDKTDRRLELQITDLDLVKGAKSMEDAAREGMKDAE